LLGWIDLELRLFKKKIINKHLQDQVNKEKGHGNKILLRIIVVVKTLAKNNLALHGSNEKIYQKNNRIFFRSN
jgi:hypothetical protein